MVPPILDVNLYVQILSIALLIDTVLLAIYLVMDIWDYINYGR